MVFLFGHLAIKIPRVSGMARVLQGLRCNRAERDAWHEREYPNLCPLIWSAPFGWLNIMERASAMSQDEFDEWFSSDDWPHFAGSETPYELKPEDAGTLKDGRRVMVDYGVKGYR